LQADGPACTGQPLSWVLIARQAYLDFGRGNHPAGLDFGDCFAYALAKAAAEPLLFKGEEFAHTDIRPYRSASNEPWSRQPS
jgi:uncharacterized protein with PIN domain